MRVVSEDYNWEALGLNNCLTLVHATITFIIQQPNAYSLAAKRSSEFNLYQSYELLKWLISGTWW